MRGLLAAGALCALLLTGCATSDEPVTEPATATSAAAGRAEALLTAHGLAGRSAVEVIDHLDRLSVDQRPAGLKASVRPSELVLSSGVEEYPLAIPGDRFYLSVAPFVDRTHECFHHSLTTCKGELATAELQVRIVDETHDKVLVDGARTTFDNGFAGFWLPRDIEGTLQVTYAGKTGRTRITTGQDAPTCLTTVQLV
ncbi:CueP family metal-binding protein [Actinoplanes sp. NPDC024001]|uniref:CueP family metal-binding protein n=1 Tax=Actinoplanes sp. NPDC024001 TaxID=3154598 RepID=UPI0033D6448C